MSRFFGTAALFSTAAAMSLTVSMAAAQQSNVRPNSSLFVKPLKDDAAKAFTKTDGGYTHWLTSIKCPSSVGDKSLIAKWQNTVQGHSVRCRLTDKKTMRTDFAIRTFDREEKLSTVVAEVGANIEKNEAVLRKTPAREVKMNFAGQTVPCVKVSYDFKPSKSGNSLSESYMACNMLNWVIQVSERGLTSAKANTNKFTHEFFKLQTAARQHLGSCMAEARKRREMQPSKATGLNIAVDRFGYQERGVPCFSGNISSKEGRDALLLLYWPQNADTPSTINSVSAGGAVNRQPVFQLQDMWATVPAAKRGEGGYVMVKNDPDGTVSSYGGFLKVIGSGRLYGEYEKVRKGELKPKTVSKPNKGGGVNMTIG